MKSRKNKASISRGGEHVRRVTVLTLTFGLAIGASKGAGQEPAKDLPAPVMEAISLPQPDSVANVPSLTLADVEQLALANNPSLAVAWSRINAARGRQVQGGLYPNPTIGYTSQDIGEEETAGQHGGFVSQEFVTGKKLQLNQAIGGREVQEQRFQLQAQELRVLSDVRLRFYDAVVAQRRIALTDELIRVSEQLADTSEKLLKAQQVAESDALQAEIEVSEARILGTNAANESDESWRRLAAVIGTGEIQRSPLVGDLEAGIPLYEWEELVAEVLPNQPELLAARVRVERARLTIARARKENIPNVNVMAMATRMNQTDDDVLGVQAGIPIPILNQNQGRIAETTAELVAAQNNVRRIELDLQDRLAMAFRRYASAKQQAVRYRGEILPRAQRTLDLVTAGYREGQVGFLSLLTGQRTFIQANLAYLDALAEFRRASVMIEGQLLTDSLQAP